MASTRRTESELLRAKMQTPADIVLWEAGDGVLGRWTVIADNMDRIAAGR